MSHFWQDSGLDQGAWCRKPNYNQKGV